MLHGTDGIRGRVTMPAASDLEALRAVVERREVNGRAFRTIGQAIGEELVALRAAGEAADGLRDCPTMARLAAAGGQVRVVIGWDRRPGNAMLVAGLTEGLHLAGVRVAHGGEVATPGLHDGLLGNGADAGLMVTASHNPATDSGVKLFDADGRKSLPPMETRIAARAWALAAASDDSQPDPDLCRPTSQMLAMSGHRATLAKRLDMFSARFGVDFTARDWSDVFAPCGLLLDSSGGAATDWLAAGLQRRGVPVREVADRTRDINAGCGAGEFSTTSLWTFDDLLARAGANEEQHALLDAIADEVAKADGAPEWPVGRLVGAALDGDGDRCLLIVVTETGVAVVDGDRMADDWLRALDVTRAEWQGRTDGGTRAAGTAPMLATTIEADLALPTSLDRFQPTPRFIECAVGDRWLAEALTPDPAGDDRPASRLLQGEAMPEVIGCEDSGHIVLPAPHPMLSDHWSLVGDGAATLLAVLCARAALAEAGDAAPAPFEAGWKRRLSVEGTERSLWDGRNEIADEAERIVLDALAETGVVDGWRRSTIDGETSLMLLRGRLDGAEVGVGIRNSGTQAKTTISIRAAADFPDLAVLVTLSEMLGDLLTERLVT